MSESSDKLIPISRGQPVQRRRRKRAVPKTGQKKSSQQPVSSPREAGKVTNHISPALISSGGRKPASQVMLYPGVKTVPPVKKNTQFSQGGTVRLRTVPIEKSKIVKKGSRKTRLKPMAKVMLYALRFLIVGVGIGAIVGTLLSVLDPASRINSVAVLSQASSPQKDPDSARTGLYLSQEITSLKDTLQSLPATNSDLTPGVFLLDLDNGAYVDINGNRSFPAASTIKIPILMAFFQDVDAGKIRLDEILTLEKEMIVGGSGNIQYQAPGSKYTALDLATKMITISDNTATNMLIAKLGGQEALNGRFRSWGLTTTMIRSPLPDLQGTNTTSPRELGNLISMVNQGNVVTMRSRDSMLNIMNRTERDNLLPAGLGKGANAYHKTGDIGTMLADAGLIDVPTGKRYIAAIMVQRPNNDPRAAKLISSISSSAYQYFSKATVQPSNFTNNQPNQPIPNYQVPIPPIQPIQPVQPVQPFIQAPMINPNVPNGMVNNVPMGTYQAPMITPQYYPQQ
ncbi:serine hydrolase [Dolichospermum circinale]|uniref:serine hydrolase n=2 Tax=Dolichospermum circinale TaxID=109265 RepID=UPI00232BEFA5|nr:serine hydrolase [Dolichospermum circinale]MDB9454190.1 class A beta-lactamase-related serine hydrolase [Dolichospermum circinale CS-541/06]MDB9464606.1 class A beta-lactamase-related serine hydrolase [Dolichospermum circinale CS-541/04]MDB9549656.1 class A beta-lactamase-related serine hydrolase [Dolichospermum circinale CS-1031]